MGQWMRACPSGHLTANASRSCPERLASLRFFTFDVDTGELTAQTYGPCEATQPNWSPDGQRLVFAWNEDGNVSVGVKGSGDGRGRGEVTSPYYVQVAPGVHSWPMFSADGKHILCFYQGPQNPCDLWRITLATRRARQLTRSLPRQFTGDVFVVPKVVRWPCDGLTISGCCMFPAQAQAPARGTVYARRTNRPVPQRVVCARAASRQPGLCCTRAQLSRQHWLWPRISRSESL